MLEIFHTLAEVAVAVTGFSSLIVVFRGNAAEWGRQDFIGLSFVLSWSIGAIFASLLPLVLAEFGFASDAVSRAGLFGLVAYMMIVAAVLTRAQARAAQETGESLPKRPRLVMGVSFCLITLLALGAAFNLLPGALQAWYAAAIVMLLGHATADLGVFVVQTTRRRGQRGDA